jgi:diacylglycerol kinase family enzyme/phosphatidylglycerophosphate synthase
MDMHTPKAKPDWHYKPSSQLSRWQSLAVYSRGLITPGNLVSLFGLILVIFGSKNLYYGETTNGLLLILIGRIMDILDGIVADLTETKSRKGEIIDTAADKLGVLVTILAAQGAGLFNSVLFTALILHHAYIVLFSSIYARRYNLHTVRSGKIAMFMSWAAIIVTIGSQLAASTLLNYLSWTIICAYIVTAIVAVVQYYRLLQIQILKRAKAAQWTKSVEKIIFIYNPKASNFRRAQRWANRISRNLKIELQGINIIEKGYAPQSLIAAVTHNKTLILIAGGDGTVGSVAGILAEKADKKLLEKIFYLPLWGGNANDFSVMLNGAHSSITPRRMLIRSGPVQIPLLSVHMQHKGIKKTLHACCYASFGASAYAARQLNSERIAQKKFIRNFPLAIIIRELLSVLRALWNAPRFKTKVGGKEMQLYEHTFINGSRIAKVNRVPLKVNEQSFFHAAVERKHPSVLLELARIITRKNRDQYVKQKSVTFTVDEGVDAQLDGEIYKVEAGTKVTIKTGEVWLNCISTKL